MAGKESLKGFFPPVGDFLELMPVGEVVGVNDAGEIQTRFPGAVVIGGDGSRELLVYDFREDPPPLTLLDITAADWSAAIYQAASLTEFLLLFPERGWVWGTSD